MHFSSKSCDLWKRKILWMRKACTNWENKKFFFNKACICGFFLNSNTIKAKQPGMDSKF